MSGAPTERVALISSSYAPAIGGVETVVRQLASGLRARGCEVEVWTVARGGTGSTEVVDDVRVRYLPAPLPSFSPRGIASFVAKFPAAWLQWRKALREFGPTVLHVHCFGPNGPYARALHRRHRVPLLVTSHGETFADDGGVFDTSMLLRASLRDALAAADAVTAPSAVVLDDLRDRFGLVGGRVIPNGIGLDDPPAGVRRSGAFFFAAGRLGRMKGFDLLVDAFARAPLDRGMRLVIAGDGPERQALLAHTDRLGLGERVELTGWLSEAEVADLMAECVAVVIPSRRESFGLVALEAWRNGAPVIMTDRGGSVVTDGVDGVVVDPTDTPALAAALVRVAGDAGLRARLAEGGSRRVRDYGWEHVVQRYQRLYRRTRRQYADRHVDGSTFARPGSMK